MNESKKLETLEEHNARRREALMQKSREVPRLNGIACPKCGAELYDGDPWSTLLSYPPKKDVFCSKCEYRGCRIA